MIFIEIKQKTSSSFQWRFISWLNEIINEESNWKASSQHVKHVIVVVLTSRRLSSILSENVYKGVFFDQSCLNLGFFSLFTHMVSYEMQCSFTFNKEGKKPSAHINNTVDCLVTITFYCCFNHYIFYKFKADSFPCCCKTDNFVIEKILVELSSILFINFEPLFTGEFWLLSCCIVMLIFFSATFGKILPVTRIKAKNLAQAN